MKRSPRNPSWIMMLASVYIMLLGQSATLIYDIVVSGHLVHWWLLAGFMLGAPIVGGLVSIAMCDIETHRREDTYLSWENGQFVEKKGSDWQSRLPYCFFPNR